MTVHRLNHHDIQAIEAVRARGKAHADAARRFNRIVNVGCVLGVLALLAMHALAWLR